MKAYLKYNRLEAAGWMSLLFWLEVFKDYDITIVCDLFDVKTQEPPLMLKNILQSVNYKGNIINTDYGSSHIFNDVILKKKYRTAGAVNTTCFNYHTSTDPFWLIDADDTFFITRDYNYLRSKLAKAEEIMRKNNYDGFGLDFYRVYNDTWSFGVALMRPGLDFNYIRAQLKDEDFVPKKDTKCLDVWFDKLRKQGKLKLESFVIDQGNFVHYIDGKFERPYNLYEWYNGKWNDKPLPKGIIIL